MHDCTRCHEYKQCSIHSTRHNKNGTKYIRYMCKECRRLRAGKDKERVRSSRYSKIDKVVSIAKEKDIKHYNFNIKYNPNRKMIISLPSIHYYSEEQKNISEWGREKNLSIIKKYANV